MNLPTKPTHLYVNHTYLTSTQVGSRPENQNRVKKWFFIKICFFHQNFWTRNARKPNKGPKSRFI